jgi:tRNA(Ile)-lysidine synthase
MMHDAEETFLRTLARHEMVRPGDRVLTAVSGGADSVLLLHLLAKSRSRCPVTLHVAHLNHGLRGAESDADEEFVRDLAARLALPVTCARADLARKPGEPSSVEERARLVRRAFLLEAAAAAGCNRIALGHTLDDQAETILMWLLRGAGRAGLSGMEPVTAEGIVRPLIDLRRRQVRRHLAAIGETYREDSTNRDLAHQRNRIRARLISLLDAEFPGSVETIAAEAALLASEDAYLDAAARMILDGAGGRLMAESLSAAPAAVARRTVRLAAQEEGIEPRSLGRLHIEEILGLAEPSNHGRGVDLPSGRRAERRGDEVVFLVREPKEHEDAGKR